MGIEKDWSHNAQFLIGLDAVQLYRRMLNAPWSQTDEEQMSGCDFGLSYTQTPNGRSDEISIIPAFLQVLAEQVSRHPSVQIPANYVQCHRVGPLGWVGPHNDPSGMIVPMLTLGQERTFRVGGDFKTRNLRQSKRPVESHIPEAEYSLKAGDLLVFNGGRTVHSMFPADRDSQFNANGCDYRISILFRWTTSIMRAMGSARRKWSSTQVQQHEDEYRAVQVRWMEEHQAQPSLF